jgi:hypothetical protein
MTAAIAVAALAVAVAVSGEQPASAQAVAQAQPAAEVPTGTIIVVGEGTATVEPDIARTTIGVEVAGETLREVTDEASVTMQAILDAVQAAGVASNDIQTSGYSIYVERRVPEGMAPGVEDTIIYRVNNSVLVTIRDLDIVGDVLDAAIDAGANNVFGVDFAVEDKSVALAESRAEAVADARARAEELAALNGVGVGKVVQISEVIDTGFGPAFPRMEAAAGLGGGAGPIAPGQQEIKSLIQVTYALVGADATGATGTVPVAGTATP